MEVVTTAVVDPTAVDIIIMVAGAEVDGVILITISPAISL